jgi:carboxypeptidase T
VFKSVVVGGVTALALLLAPGVASPRVLATGAASGVASAPRTAARPSIKRFVVYGVYTREQRSQLVSEGYDIGEAAWADHVELYGSNEQAAMLALRGYRVVRSLQPDDFPPPDSGYHNYAEMVAAVQALAAAHPATVHLFSLGTSFEGRNLIGARVSNDATDNLSEPGVFYVGQHHAREHMTVEVVLSLLHRFVEKPMTANLINSRQMYFVPSLNPDGAEWDIHTGSYLYWRKNRQPPNGTDNNRNYPYNWGCCGGSDGDPNGETYRGPSPLSTPEDARMADFMIAHPNVKTGISYHSYGDLILYPYGYTYVDVPPDMTQLDHDTFVAMGAEMERTAGYHAQQSSDLYITDGDWNDYMYGALHRYPITIELDGHGYGFYPPDELIAAEALRNHQAAIFVAHIADCPTRIVGVGC